MTTTVFKSDSWYGFLVFWAYLSVRCYSGPASGGRWRTGVGADSGRSGVRTSEIVWQGREARRRRNIIGSGLEFGNVDDVHGPEDPILGGGSMRNVVGDGVPPRRRTAIGAEECASLGFELQVDAVLYGLPLNGRVHFGCGNRLDNLFAGPAEEEGFVGGGQVAAVAALETDNVGLVRDELYHPPCFPGGADAALPDRFFVVVGDKVLVEVASEPDGFGFVEELHRELANELRDDGSRSEYLRIIYLRINGRRDR